MLGELARLGARLIIQRAVEEERALLTGRQSARRAPRASAEANPRRTAAARADGDYSLSLTRTKTVLTLYRRASAAHEAGGRRRSRCLAAQRRPRGEWMRTCQ